MELKELCNWRKTEIEGTNLLPLYYLNHLNGETVSEAKYLINAVLYTKSNLWQCTETAVKIWNAKNHTFHWTITHFSLTSK